MPDLKSLEGIYVAVAFFVPGMIVLFVRAQFITGRTPSHAEAALSYITISVLYYTAALPLVALLPRDLISLYWFLLIFVGPALFGLLLGLSAQKEVLRRALEKIHLHPVHAVPTAWDYKFGRMGPEFVLITLKDGTKFAGFYTPDSFSSSDVKERDIFIENTYDLDDQNKWTPRANSLWIAGGEIRTIEFWPRQPEVPKNE